MNVFSRMTGNVLRLLGEPALLRGDVECTANIEHGVQLTGMDGESALYRGDLVVLRDVATIDAVHAPKAGDRVTFPVEGGGRHAGLTYRLEVLLEDNGYSRRYTVLQVS